MTWKTLYDKVGKQPLHFSQNNAVYAILDIDGQPVKVLLELKYDAKSRPYFVQADP